MEKIKYITNKELLAEIHKSKNSYCFYEKPEYSNYDAIVTDLSAITPEFITQVYEKKFAFATKKNLELPVKENLVFRLMTDEHIPDETDLKKRKRNTEETSIRTCFHPFKHYIMRDGSPVEVGRSHWKDGAFSDVHGKMTNRLAIMLMLLVERYSRRANWRGYTYNDEMRSHALLQLSEVGLRFNESKSDNPNPFAFYTTIIKNCFTRILNNEKKVQHIRDDLLIMADKSPSYTRQIEHEAEQKFEENKTDVPETTEKAVVPKKRGRKPKSEKLAIV